MKKLTLCLLVLLFACSLFIACNPSTSVDSSISSGVNSSIEEDLSDSSAISGNTHDYTTFTASEKRLFQEYFGEVVIPFIANDEYYLEEYLLDNEDGTYEEGLNFYTVGNSGTEFESYLELFSVFTKDGTSAGDYSIWYFYSKGEIYIDLSYYYYEGDYIVDVYVYLLKEGDLGSGGDNDGNGGQEEDETPQVIELTSSALNLGNYRNGSETVSGYTFEFIALGDYGNGIQMKNKEGVTTKLWNEDGFEKGISKIEFVYTQSQANYSNNNALKIEFGKNDSFNLQTTYLSTTKGSVNYTIIPNATDYNFVRFTNNISYALYFQSITIYLGGDSGLGGGSSSGSGDNEMGSGNTNTHTYTEFSADDKNLFKDYFGSFIIPFIANDEYYLEEYSHEYADGSYEEGLNFYTFGNTQAEFDLYKNAFSTFTFDGTDKDEYGDTWYLYSKGDICIDFSYYYGEEDYVVDLYVYYYYEDISGGSGSGSGGGSGDNGSSNDNINLITNDGKGLPSGTNGVYTVDFTKAKYVKNVTEQGYYLDGCPTLSTASANPTVLVVPVQFSDRLAKNLNYTIETLNKAFNGGAGTTDYYSVHDYYLTSSYGKLEVDFTVLDSWYTAKNNSYYYSNKTMDYYGSEVFIGDQVLLDEILQSLSLSMDLSKFDSDDNGVIDAVIMINTLEIDEQNDFNWAYRYWNIYTDNNGYYYEYDGVFANDYLWASYQFLFENYDSEGNISFDDKNAINTYTFIHEFGHILGVDDYYDTSGKTEPMEGCDVMDSMLGDHNPFTKFNLGWITTSRLITTKSSVIVQLEEFSKNGDTIIIANNWDDDLGVYQEYYILIYYTNLLLYLLMQLFNTQKSRIRCDFFYSLNTYPTFNRNF